MLKIKVNWILSGGFTPLPFDSPTFTTACLVEIGRGAHVPQGSDTTVEITGYDKPINYEPNYVGKPSRFRPSTRHTKRRSYCQAFPSNTLLS